MFLKSYLIDGGSEDKNQKAQKQFLITRNLKFENYENCLEIKSP